MCTRDEVKQEILASERRMQEKLFSSHNAIAQTVSQVGADIKRLRQKLEAHMDNEDKNYREITLLFTNKLDEYIVSDSNWKVTVDEYMKEMLPVKDGVHAIQTLNKFAKWIGLPAVGAMIVYWLTK